MAPTPKPSRPAPTALPLPALAGVGEMASPITVAMNKAVIVDLFIFPRPFVGPRDLQQTTARYLNGELRRVAFSRQRLGKKMLCEGQCESKGLEDRLLTQTERPRHTGVVGDGNFKVESRHASEI
jgi:hypothetical protein